MAALVRAIEICALVAEEGAELRIFTGSQAAMGRLRNDQPGPGQRLARRGIRVACEGIRDRGAHVQLNGSRVTQEYLETSWQIAGLLTKLEERTG